MHILHLLESVLCSSCFSTIFVSHPTVKRLPRSVWSMWPAMMTYPAVVMMLRLRWGYYPSVGALMLWILHHTYTFRRWKWARRSRLGVRIRLWYWTLSPSSTLIQFNKPQAPSAWPQLLGHIHKFANPLFGASPLAGRLTFHCLGRHTWATVEKTNMIVFVLFKTLLAILNHKGMWSNLQQ